MVVSREGRALLPLLIRRTSRREIDGRRRASAGISIAPCVGDTLGLMHWARARLTRLTGVWLVCHLLIVVLGAQSALRASLVTTGIVQAGCTCDHGHAGMCPMHRNRSTSGPSRGSCAYHGTSDPLGAVVA